MNVVDKVLPKSITLIWQYHSSKNVRVRCHLDVKVKHLKFKDEKKIKPTKIRKNIMDT